MKPRLDALEHARYRVGPRCPVHGNRRWEIVMPFPESFLWGAATAAYQIEGAAGTDGRKPSVWDSFCDAGKVARGDNARQSCDHYGRYRDDVAIMSELGLKAYRFSISWPRVVPMGTGAVNEKGLAFYDGLVDALLDAGIRPLVTLFHWDYPLALHHRGGWLSADAPQWFAEYTAVVIDRLSDRVTDWMTLNEPQVFLDGGYRSGAHAPGLALDPPDLLRAVHHVLLAHGRSVQVIRERAKRPASIGWATAVVGAFPQTESAQDVEATRAWAFSCRDAPGSAPTIFANALYADPIHLGHYPEDFLAAHADSMPRRTSEDMACIASPVDFLGINAYFGSCVRADENGAPDVLPEAAGAPRNTLGWPITPDVLRWSPLHHAQRYDTPILITENGLSGHDWVLSDGSVQDPLRIDYTTRYLRALERAIEDGVDIRGYFHWSLLDNFEWSEGFQRRFGLVHVDYQTLRRTPKASAHWYARVIASNGAVLSENHAHSHVDDR
jgi:beta-glucosidase